MIALPVYNREGQQVDTVNVDEEIFGRRLRSRLLKQALVMYQANDRLGTVATRSRGLVEGSTRKLYRQKHTGRARMGTVRTVVRRGGGVAFAKVPRDFSLKMPKKARRVARNSAILAKMRSRELLLIDEIGFEQPSTKQMANILKALKINASCLVGLPQHDVNSYRSIRNIPGVDVLPVDEFNAYNILSHKKLLISKAGFVKLQELARQSARPAKQAAGEPEQGR
jgi:large subunit ribosomal protein L4